MIFTELDKQTRLFESIKESLKADLAKLREKNDTQKNEIETAFIRGRIAQLKDLLDDMGEKQIIQQAPRRNPYNP